MTYVAGDRVVTDLLCKPFSMGKNLLCVHSKKHMDDDPSQKSAKMKQNLNTVKAMQRLLKKGGLLIWIAPAGGRDRRDADGQITPGNWDPAAVEMMRKLGTKKGMTKTHYYPLGEFIFHFRTGNLTDVVFCEQPWPPTTSCPRRRRRRRHSAKNAS